MAHITLNDMRLIYFTQRMLLQTVLKLPGLLHPSFRMQNAFLKGQHLSLQFSLVNGKRSQRQSFHRLLFKMICSSFCITIQKMLLQTVQVLPGLLHPSFHMQSAFLKVQRLSLQFSLVNEKRLRKRWFRRLLY